jgi:hypothetical protein
MVTVAPPQHSHFVCYLSRPSDVKPIILLLLSFLLLLLSLVILVHIHHV